MIGEFGHVGRLGGEAALSVEARYLEPDLPIELDDAYAQTFDRLRRFFRARGCTPEESADLAQEAAVRAFLHIRRWGVASGGLDPLLNRISRNLLIDRYRRVAPHLVPLESAGDLQDPEQDPTEEVARKQRRHAVRHAISSLPSRHRAAITYSLSGLSPEEVGRRMGIGRNAADALLHRARRSLREYLAPVREGMWGAALMIRVRWDRLTRRAGIQGNGVDASGALLSNSAAGLATAAIVLVVALGGGGGGGTSFASIDHSLGVPAVVGTTDIGSRNSMVQPSTPSGATTTVPSAGSGGGNTFRFGPTTTTSHGPHGVSNEIAVPDPGDRNGPPLVEVQQWIWRDDRAAPPPDDQQDLVTRTICKAGDSACGVVARHA